MLTSLPVTIVIALILGFLAGLGVGGGSILILWLTIVQDYPPEEARILNLLFFLPAAAISCFFRWRQGSISIGNVLPAILSGCAAAIVCCLLRDCFDTQLLRKLFGCLLIFTGIRELFFRKTFA